MWTGFSIKCSLFPYLLTYLQSNTHHFTLCQADMKLLISQDRYVLFNSFCHPSISLFCQYILDNGVIVSTDYKNYNPTKVLFSVRREGEGHNNNFGKLHFRCMEYSRKIMKYLICLRNGIR